MLKYDYRNEKSLFLWQNSGETNAIISIIQPKGNFKGTEDFTMKKMSVSAQRAYNGGGSYIWCPKCRQYLNPFTLFTIDGKIHWCMFYL